MFEMTLEGEQHSLIMIIELDVSKLLNFLFINSFSFSDFVQQLSIDGKIDKHQK